MAVRIVTDSSSEYVQEESVKKGVTLMPLRVSFGDEEYLDGFNLSKEDFYRRLIAGENSHTSQCTPQDFLPIFQEIADAGDEAVVVPLSSALSGTLQSALIAKEMLDYDGIYVLDAHCVTAQLHILIDYAVKLRSEGLGAKDIADRCMELSRRINVRAYIPTLEYLYRGGRVTRAQANMGTLAHIKPVIRVSRVGAVEVEKKCIGAKKAYEYIVSCVENTDLDPEFPLVLVYSADYENCSALEKLLREKGLNPDPEAICSMGAVIGSHVGPGICGAIYVQREPDKE